MTRTPTPYDYKAVAAPHRARRFKGVRSRADAFARTVAEAIAAEAVDGWEFQRAETLPAEERAGWFGGRVSVMHSLLIFRRTRPEARASEPEAPSVPYAPPPDPQPAPAPGPTPVTAAQEPVLRLDKSAEPAAPRLGPADG